MTDYGKTVMRQYANSVTLQALLADFDQWVDPAKFTADFLLHVWDISTATGFGLDIWGRILGQSRYLQIQQVPGDNFGFNINATPGTQWKPWSQAPFYNGQAGGDVSFALQDDAYRQLLLVKAASNIASCDVPSINALMRARRSSSARKDRCLTAQLRCGPSKRVAAWVAAEAKARRVAATTRVATRTRLRRPDGVRTASREDSCADAAAKTASGRRPVSRCSMMRTRPCFCRCARWW